MSTGYTAEPAVDTSYGQGIGLYQQQSEAAYTAAAEAGPKCAECGKSYKIPGKPGGCTCPRYQAARPGPPSSKTIAVRTCEAYERLGQLLEAYLKANGLEVPPAAASAAAQAPTGTPVDAIRARHEATKAKAS